LTCIGAQWPNRIEREQMAWPVSTSRDDRRMWRHEHEPSMTTTTAHTPRETHDKTCKNRRPRRGCADDSSPEQRMRRILANVMHNNEAAERWYRTRRSSLRPRRRRKRRPNSQCGKHIDRFLNCKRDSASTNSCIHRGLVIIIRVDSIGSISGCLRHSAPSADLTTPTHRRRAQSAPPLCGLVDHASYTRHSVFIAPCCRSSYTCCCSCNSIHHRSCRSTSAHPARVRKWRGSNR
jgi:hypothetical protein